MAFGSFITFVAFTVFIDGARGGEPASDYHLAMSFC
jgi:hypothetical protein